MNERVLFLSQPHKKKILKTPSMEFSTSKKRKEEEIEKYLHVLSQQQKEGNKKNHAQMYMR